MTAATRSSSRPWSRPYDFAEMTRVPTGRYWRSFTDDQNEQVVAAFYNLSIATYAACFDGSSGERFEVLGEEPAPTGNLRVNTQIATASGEPVRIDYLLRQDDGQSGHRRGSEVIRERTGRAPRRIHGHSSQSGFNGSSQDDAKPISAPDDCSPSGAMNGRKAPSRRRLANL